MAKPIPRPTPTEQPFYDACSEGKLVLQHCQHCGHVLFYPRTHCDACQSDQLAWEDASGAGTIASYTVVRRAVSADFETPYVIALIDLAEGPRMMSQIIDAFASGSSSVSRFSQSVPMIDSYRLGNLRKMSLITITASCTT